MIDLLNTKQLRAGVRNILTRRLENEFNKEELAMEDDLVFKKNTNVISRVIEDETILLPLYQNSDEIDCIYTLNTSAARVWELINGKQTLGKIKKVLLNEFDATPAEIDKEVHQLLIDLREIKAITACKS